jgi:hypothetical protein
MTRVTPLLTLMIAVLVAGSASADFMTSWQTQSYGYSSTNWSTNLTFNQFDNLGGSLILTGIEWILDGYSQGTVQFENEGGGSETIVYYLKADVTLKKPDTSTISLVIPTATNGPGGELVASYDGTTDWGGTSGRTYEGLSGSDSDTGVLTAPADLTAFTGAGTIDLPTSAQGTSYGSGGGSLSFKSTTEAKAEARIRYLYTDAIPEPGTAGLMLVGLAAVGLLRRRTR